MAIEAIRSLGFIRPIAPLEEQHEVSEINAPIPIGIADAPDRLEALFEEREIPAVRPKLPISVQLAGLLDEQESLTAKALDLDTQRIRAAQSILSKTNESIMDQINARRSKATEVSMWGMLGDVANFITGATAFITGGMLIASAAPFAIITGGMLVVGGVSSITSLCLRNFGGDDKLAGTLAVLGAGLTLMGGMISWNQIVNQVPQAIATLGSCALGILNGISMVGRGVSESSMTYIDKLLLEKQEAARQTKEDIDRTRDDMQAAVRQIGTITKKMKDTLKALEDAKRQILQG